MRTALCCLFLTASAFAEIRVSTDFEGGNAEVVSLDQHTKTLRIMLKLHEGRGWPCWWYFRLDGLTLGETITLEVQAQTKPFSGDQVLAADWCQPKHAWLSSDGETWTASDEGTRSADKVMSSVAKQSGKPYKWGAAGPRSFDCSGLVQYSYKLAGKSIGRTSGGPGSVRPSARARAGGAEEVPSPSRDEDDE